MAEDDGGGTGAAMRTMWAVVRRCGRRVTCHGLSRRERLGCGIASRNGSAVNYDKEDFSALKALGYDDPDIQAFLRWRDPASIATYAHREPDEYIAALSRALSVDITSVLTKNLPTCDNDAEVAALQRTQFPGDSADDSTPTDDERATHAERQVALAEAPPTAASRPAAPPLAGLRLPGFGAAPSSPPRPSTPQPDPSLLATPGLTYERSDVTPGSEVAVRFDAPHPAYFRGTVRSCRGRNARVLFADGEMLDVDYELLRRIV